MYVKYDQHLLSLHRIHLESSGCDSSHMKQEPRGSRRTLLHRVEPAELERCDALSPCLNVWNASGCRDDKGVPSRVTRPPGAINNSVSVSMDCMPRKYVPSINSCVIVEAPFTVEHPCVTGMQSGMWETPPRHLTHGSGMSRSKV